MFERMKSVVSAYADKAFNAAMEKVRPEYIGVNALAGSFALLVMADRKVEREEMEAVSEFLIDMDIIIEKKMIREVSEFFLYTTKRLEDAFKEGPVQGNTEVGEILGDIAKVKEYPEWKKALSDTVKLVTSGVGVDEREQKTRDRILRAIS